VTRATATDGAWTAIAEGLTSQGTSTSYTDTTAPAEQAFYRVAAFAPPALFETSFEPGEDLSGWTEVIVLGETQWEVGAPTTGPGSARTGVNVLATKLADDYSLNQEVGYRSPVIDLTGRESATLQFYTYYEFEPVDPEGLPFDWGDVNLLDATTGQNLLPNAVPALHYEGAFRNWRRVSYPLPAEALGKSIRIEFKLFSDVFTTFPGWYIDDIRVD
jgi:bacillopeptidase F